MGRGNRREGRQAKRVKQKSTQKEAEAGEPKKKAQKTRSDDFYGNDAKIAVAAVCGVKLARGRLLTRAGDIGGEARAGQMKRRRITGWWRALGSRCRLLREQKNIYAAKKT